jgi:general secretion pathway protein A
MYLSHYGLTEQPFGISTDPGSFWKRPQLEDAFEKLTQALQRQEPCVAVTGDVGTGKTIFIRALLHAADASGMMLTIADPGLGAGDFFGSLALELGMAWTRGGRQEFYEALAQFLQRPGAPQMTWLIVEEAHRLAPEVLGEVVALADFRAAARRWFGVILVGTPALDAQLGMPENESILRRVGARAHLTPLTASETRHYIAHRLERAGAERPLFDPTAIEAIHLLSRGYPRLINMLCDHALLYGYGSHQDEITDRIVHDCSQDLLVALERDTVPEVEYAPGMVARMESPAPPPDPGPPHPAHDLRRIAALSAAAVLAGLILFWLLR